MVARLVRDQEVVGSNPVASTNKKRRVFALLFCCIAVILLLPRIVQHITTRELVENHVIIIVRLYCCINLAPCVDIFLKWCII